MTLLSQYLNIHFQFKIYFIFFLNFILFYFKPPIKNSSFFLNRRKAFIFCFAACATLFVLCCLHIVISSEALGRLRCHLFERVALLLLSFPQCFEPHFSTPSLCFVQSTGAFTFSVAFHLHTCSSWPHFLTVSLAVCSRMFPECSRSFFM